MIRVTEKVVEPSKIFVGSTFLLKIKVFKGLTYNELKQMSYTEAMDYKYSQMKGD